MENHILVLDNYDSFTYNLVHMLRELVTIPITVKRNDEIELDEISMFSHIVLSPGPGIPDEAGIMKQLIARYAPEKSILGICLGHQGIAEVFGGRLQQMEVVMHGKKSCIQLLSHDSIFKSLPANLQVGRYHSWIVERESLPKTLEIIAEDSQGQIMALQHSRYKVFGVQFHPESIMTEKGKQILQQWMEM